MNTPFPHIPTHRAGKKRSAPCGKGTNPAGTSAPLYIHTLLRRVSFTLLLFLFLSNTLQAQDLLHATFAEWAIAKRIQLLDRSHALGDELTDRGAFLHISPRTDREYELDRMVHLFSFEEDYRWHRGENGFRMRNGSVTRSRFGFVADFVNTLPLAPRHTGRLRGVLQKDPHADRAFVELGYDWRMHGKHQLGVRHTFGDFKPDMDVSLAYTYGDFETGRLQLGVSLLDTYNNFIFNTLGVDEEELVRVYDKKPYLLSLSMVSPTLGPLRAEAYVGLQTQSRADISYLAVPEDRFQQEEDVHFLGGLLEFSHRWGTAGLLFRDDRSRLERLGTGGTITSAYSNEQTLREYGAFALRRLWRFRMDVWFWVAEYRDQQEGEDFSLSSVDEALDYREKRHHFKARLIYKPYRTYIPFFGAEYVSVARDLISDDVKLAVKWSRQWYYFRSSNDRIVLMMGYHFPIGWFSMGISYDVDGDSYDKSPDINRFDGGQVRLSINW